MAAGADKWDAYWGEVLKDQDQRLPAAEPAYTAAQLEALVDVVSSRWYCNKMFNRLKDKGLVRSTSHGNFPTDLGCEVAFRVVREEAGELPYAPLDIGARLWVAVVDLAAGTARVEEDAVGLRAGIMATAGRPWFAYRGAGRWYVDERGIGNGIVCATAGEPGFIWRSNGVPRPVPGRETLPCWLMASVPESVPGRLEMVRLDRAEAEQALAGVAARLLPALSAAA